MGTIFRFPVPSAPRSHTRSRVARLGVLFHTGLTSRSSPGLELNVVPRFRNGRSITAPKTRAPIFLRPHLVDWGRRHGAARGAFRVFAPAVFRFYRSSSGPPAESDPFFATSSSLPATPGTSFPDGTWYLAVSYFNGLVDSGFLAIGPEGEPYRILVVSSGASGSSPPASPIFVTLKARAGGVIRVVAYYAETGASRADTWALAFTTDGSSPPANSPSVTQGFTNTSGPQLLVYDLPAQPDGTTLTVLVQTRRGSTYSVAGEPLAAIADAVGPTSVLAGDAWRGALP